MDSPEFDRSNNECIAHYPIFLAKKKKKNYRHILSNIYKNAGFWSLGSKVLEISGPVILQGCSYHPSFLQSGYQTG